MGMKLTPAIPQAVTKYNITVDGQYVGQVEQQEDRKHKYRATLQVSITTYQKAYVYGYADTPEAAITTAINTGRQEALKQIEELDKLAMVEIKI